MGTRRALGCCCCGGDAGRWEQWWNRDTGYGVCAACVAWVRSRGETEAEIHDNYGTDMFLGFWRALNAALVVRGEPEALHGEARRWWDWRPVKFVDDRLVNRVVNERRPI